jgi:hypothetical protein
MRYEHNRVFWQRVIAAVEVGGEHAEVAAHHGVSVGVLRWWLYKLRKERGAASPTLRLLPVQGAQPAKHQRCFALVLFAMAWHAPCLRSIVGRPLAAHPCSSKGRLYSHYRLPSPPQPAIFFPGDAASSHRCEPPRLAGPIASPASVRGRREHLGPHLEATALLLETGVVGAADAARAPPRRLRAPRPGAAQGVARPACRSHEGDRRRPERG